MKIIYVNFGFYLFILLLQIKAALEQLRHALDPGLLLHRYHLSGGQLLGPLDCNGYVILVMVWSGVFNKLSVQLTGGCGA